MNPFSFDCFVCSTLPLRYRNYQLKKVNRKMRNVLFAFNLAQAITRIIEFTKDSNVKLFRKATSKPSEDLFECVTEDLLQFLKTLSDRAT